MVYLNHLKKATLTLRKLITEETKLEVHYDQEYRYRANAFFNIIPQTSEVTERYAGKDRLMHYELIMRYYLRKAGYGKHTHQDILNEMTERVIKLFSNNPQPENVDGVNWDDYYYKWSHTPEYYNLLQKYVGHNFYIDEINYLPSRTDSELVPDLHIVEYDMSFNLLDAVPVT
ncbi:TPA: hypothetical protein DE059_02805 [Candidatus Peribacteria bacterium]|jgi:hypothetical protein|nr:hypothetical protein [Candidatus Peribacteria bacterium]|tara:strand:+ start:624 stop:1142 length:519 start_codon:yes stop_codon:yes gene_type:complete